MASCGRYPSSCWVSNFWCRSLLRAPAPLFCRHSPFGCRRVARCQAWLPFAQYIPQWRSSLNFWYPLDPVFRDTSSSPPLMSHLHSLSLSPAVPQSFHVSRVPTLVVGPHKRRKPLLLNSSSLSRSRSVLFPLRLPSPLSSCLAFPLAK